MYGAATSVVHSRQTERARYLWRWRWSSATDNGQATPKREKKQKVVTLQSYNLSFLLYALALDGFRFLQMSRISRAETRKGGKGGTKQPGQY